MHSPNDDMAAALDEDHPVRSPIAGYRSLALNIRTDSDPFLQAV
jgi:hypothetical protein